MGYELRRDVMGEYLVYSVYCQDQRVYWSDNLAKAETWMLRAYLADKSASYLLVD